MGGTGDVAAVDVKVDVDVVVIVVVGVFIMMAYFDTVLGIWGTVGVDVNIC